MVGILYSIVIFIGLVLFETVFVAMFSGYLFIQIKSPLIEHAGFLLTLAQDDLVSTLRFVLLEKPLFVIQSQYKATDTTVWSLHYFAVTVFVHGVVAYLLAEMMRKYDRDAAMGFVPLLGATLLTLSSLYLLLAACCTGGPNWIVQTWLLAIVFNPITSSNATIKLYQSIKDGFVILQVLSGGAGAYLLLWYRRKYLHRDSLTEMV